MNDLGQPGIAMREATLSITLHMQTGYYSAGLKKYTHGRCCVSSLRGGVEVRLLSGRRLANYLFSA